MQSMKQNYKYLQFAPFQSMTEWSVAHLLNSDLGFTKKYPFVRIGDVIQRSTILVIVKDDIQYKQITLKINGGGAVLRDVKFGKDIKTKKQYLAKEGQFIMSKIDARNGAFGVITKELDDAIVTAEFPVFDVDADKISPVYLSLLSATKPFVQYAQKCSRGTTNRQRIDIDEFLGLQIPLPSIEEQHKIIDAYDDALLKAGQCAKHADDIDSLIEAYLQEKLGINADDIIKESSENSKRYSYLHFYSYKEMSDRWDMYNTTHSVFDTLKQSSYPIKKLGEVYGFVTRSWKKEGEEFNYIEIGNVSPREGIVGEQRLKVKDAPSRATQTIQAGDLIIGTTRPYLKRFAVVSEAHNNDVCSSGFQVVESKDTYNIRYLYEYLLTSFATKQFKYYMTGALYPAISSKELRKVQIPLPPLDKQNEIVAHTAALRDEQKNLQQQASALREQAQRKFEQIIFNK